MKKRQDARRLDHKTLTELRRRAVAQVQGGESPEIITRALGIARATMYGWLALYRSGGWRALDANKRGGRPPKLNGKALAWVYSTVTTKDPMQMKFPFALWTTSMIATLIRRRFGVRLSRSSVSRLLNQLGLSAQRPLWRAYQQNPEDVERWLKKDYPRIVTLARRDKAQIYFADEAGVRSDFHSGTTWGVRGRTPVVSTTGARFGMNLLSAVNRRGQMRFMVTKGRVGARTFLDFLRRLLKDVRGSVFLIVDGHSAHKARIVKKYAESCEGRLRLFYLPGYSPELNPDEWVWNDLKNNGIGRNSITTKSQLHKAVLVHMRHLQKSPTLIRSFFQAPTTRYAA